MQTYQWENSKEKGKEFNLTAKEWNLFMGALAGAINRAGYDLSKYSLPIVHINDAFTAEIFNSVRNILITLGWTSGKDIPIAVKGEPITANHLNSLVSKYNEAVRNL